MTERFLPGRLKTAHNAFDARGGGRLRQLAVGAALAALVAGTAVSAQVITIDTSGKGPVAETGQVDRRYQQIEPTKVELPKNEMDTKGRLMLVRYLEAEQGFAMRPFPRGHKGLTLEANGKLEPAGEKYLNMVTQYGMSAKPGDRLVITNVKIDGSKIVLDLNGGPDPKHRFLRHIQIGMDPTMTQPVVQDADQGPTGARLTLDFKGHVPELTGSQVEDLLAPLISFKVKTPVEAYTDTLPSALKKAILDHEVLVGMTTDMVMFAKGQPYQKSREMEGQEPITIWMYGKPPQTVEFVRINGNRVIRVEIARIGKPVEVFSKDVVTPMMMGSGKRLETLAKTRTVREGDVERNPDTQAPAPPPTLRNPGEQLPQDNGRNDGVMKPVYFPPDTQDSDSGQGTTLGQNPDVQPPATSKPASAPAGNTKQEPASGSQQTPPASGQAQNVVATSTGAQ